jgi:hypothetical protein
MVDACFGVARTQIIELPIGKHDRHAVVKAVRRS